MKKTIYTSYYAKNGKNPKSLAISLVVPNWYNFGSLTELAPTWSIVHKYKKGRITEEEYKIEYLDLLKKRNLTPAKIVDKIPENSILLCYEKSSDFCHRHILASYIQEYANIEEILDVPLGIHTIFD